MFSQRCHMLSQFRGGKFAGANHKIMHRFNKRKEVRSLVFSDLREVCVRVQPHVFHTG